MPWLFFVMVLLPKNLISWATGVLARIEWPKFLALPICKAFVRSFRIDMSEAVDSIDKFRSIEQVFTRRIHSDLRPFSGVICSPADGTLAVSAPASDSMFLQVKGLQYSLDDLFFGHRISGPLAGDFGWACTVYLAPHNYHRVHVPAHGYLHGIRYLPGQLWPVNRPFVRGMPRLFCRNERLVFDLSFDGDKERFFLVMVGAFNVGRMSTEFWPELTTNDLARQLLPEVKTISFANPLPLTQGDELGVFALGSTVVLGFSQKVSERFRFVETYDYMPVKMGTPLTE